MVLNIFPRRPQPAAAPAPEPEATLPEPSPEVMEDLDEPKKRPTRRGSRGGRGRSRAAGVDGVETADEEVAAAEPVAEEAAPARAPRRSRAKAAEAVVETELSAEAPAEPIAAAPRPRRGTPRQQAEIKAREEAAAAAAAEESPAAAAPPPAEAREAREPREPREPRTRGGGGGNAAPSDNALVRAIEQQGRQIEQLIEAVRRGGGVGGAISSAPPARVGVFVDAANVELASDRLRARFDWGKILNMLTRDRQLIRAIAYSPVHDDPGVSIETQRFVEPFLGKGYKVVTKPLKRFQDGTIKANVDIEMALDVIEMLDRLDVVCLVSGDGDFQRLVEVVQSKGVRVEVVAAGNSAAGNLRNAADQFIDLQQRLRDVRV